MEAPDVRARIAQDPRGVLGAHEQGAIFDEIQRAPQLMSYLQAVVDEKPAAVGRFILTGSQQFELMASVTQSLAGRTALIRLLPLSLNELAAAGLLVSDPWLHVYTGFYPRVWHAQQNPTQAASFYVSTYLERDLRQLANIGDLATFERFLRLSAAYVGQTVNTTKMAADVGVSHKTIAHWLSLLEASYVAFRLQPYHVNIKKRLVKAPKLYFYDVGLACFLLGIESAAQVAAHPLRGNLFENMVIADVMKARFNQVRASNLFFYRDHGGLEVDLVLEEALGVRLIEIKSGATFHPEFAASLDRFEGKQVLEKHVIYGGTEHLRMRDIEVRPWSALAAFEA